ncbi:hypothetical protein ACFE04_014172 [Oxalis oulophora]
MDDEDTLPPVLPPEPDQEPIIINPPVADVAAETTRHDPSLSFFMHDILGGSAPSERIVTGLNNIDNTQTTTLPFSKPNGARTFPLNGGIGIPLVAGAGLNGASTTTIVFGTVTVIDDELTETQELGSLVIGKAQGFFLASSADGNSHTMVFTSMFDREGEDTISFFGVHRTASYLSHLAIVGGTGKYVDAEGYATIQTLRLDDQHTTDGVDTILQFNELGKWVNAEGCTTKNSAFGGSAYNR